MSPLNAPQDRIPRPAPYDRRTLEDLREWVVARTENLLRGISPNVIIAEIDRRLKPEADDARIKHEVETARLFFDGLLLHWPEALRDPHKREAMRLLVPKLLDLLLPVETEQSAPHASVSPLTQTDDPQDSK